MFCGLSFAPLIEDSRFCKVCVPTTRLTIVIDCDVNSIVEAHVRELEVLMHTDFDDESVAGFGFDVSLACARLGAGIIVGVMMKF